MRPSANWRVVRLISYVHSSGRPESRNAASLKHLGKVGTCSDGHAVVSWAKGAGPDAFWLSQRLASN